MGIIEGKKEEGDFGWMDTEKHKGVVVTKPEDYEFADLMPEELDMLMKTEKDLREKNNSDIVLLAYKKKKVH